ncbi:hypothetical protein BH11MYX1_BH11MYX1_06690 [soil metagenome]
MVRRGFFLMHQSLCLGLMFLVACGGSSGSGDSPGSGTSTLLVTGEATATPRISNARAASDFDTDFAVVVELAGAAVSTGTVTVTGSGAPTALTFTASNGGGHWEGAASGYDQSYQLEVKSGPDAVSGVIVDGPDIQVITSPTAGASLDSVLPFTATWDRAAAADIARVQAGDNGNAVDVPDTGSYTVSAGTLHADKDQARTNTFRITRTNRISPAGAVTGSQFTVGVVNELDVVAAPCPTC